MEGPSSSSSFVPAQETAAYGTFLHNSPTITPDRTQPRVYAPTSTLLATAALIAVTVLSVVVVRSGCLSSRSVPQLTQMDVQPQAQTQGNPVFPVLEMTENFVFASDPNIAAQVHAEAHECARHHKTKVRSATVYLNSKDDKATLEFGKMDERGRAFGHYVDSVECDGWGRLHITAPTPSNISYDELRMSMYAAGYLEAVLTYERIFQHYYNTYIVYFGKTAWKNPGPDPVHQFLSDNLQWLRAQYAVFALNPTAEGVDRRYWQAVGGLLAQFDGLVEGYASIAPPGFELSEHDLFVLQSYGDLTDLLPALNRSSWKPLRPGHHFSRDYYFRHAAEAAAAAEKKATKGSNHKSTIETKGDKGDKGDDHNKKDETNRMAPGFRCSALIRILPDKSDVFMAHTTWDAYTSAHKTYKYYDLPVPVLLSDEEAVEETEHPPHQESSPSTSTTTSSSKDNSKESTNRYAKDKDERRTSSHYVSKSSKEKKPVVRRRRNSFTSSPGWFASLDDWYVLDNGMVILETTNGIMRPSLFELIVPNSVLTWMRSMLANMLARNGWQWVETFTRYNSGTYNNQWMVVNLNRFTIGTGFMDGGFIVAEQIPADIIIEDLSMEINRKGWYASYNVPYFDSIWRRSGFAEMYQKSKFGSEYSHKLCPRAQIFARDAPLVFSVEGMKHLVRYNNYRMDPLSLGHPSNSIASRFDLESDPDYFGIMGAIDAKVTTLKRAMQTMSFDAVMGPTWENLPVFTWEKWPHGGPHLGQPEKFNFTWVPMMPPASVLDKVKLEPRVNLV